MARFVKGDIVLLPFPFSGEENYKHRPASILASWSYAGSTDHLVCLITTQSANDPHLTELLPADTFGASLTQTCYLRPTYLRPTYLFSPDERIISRRMDRLKPEKLEQIVQMIIKVLTE